jgi:hypothetical protein
MRYQLFVYVLCLLATTTHAQPNSLPNTDSTAPIIGIDHIPLIVKDVDVAADTYRHLGFAIKPGRTHTDGIRNEHVKFVDGAGIELVTAPAAIDPLTTRYRMLLSSGEGPAYVSFHTSSLPALKDRLSALEKPYSIDDTGILQFRDPELQWFFFFAGTNRSPTDRPEHFAHLNKASATIAVWIAGGDQTLMLSVFRALGARVGREWVYVPDPVAATVATVANGKVVFLASDRQVIRGRPIIGATFRTTDLHATLKLLPQTVVDRSMRHDDVFHRSLFVSPRDALGMWLEFREQRE